jgi:hypothetical protein
MRRPQDGFQIPYSCVQFFHLLSGPSITHLSLGPLARRFTGRFGADLPD